MLLPTVLKLLKMATGMRSLLDTVMQALPQVTNVVCFTSNHSCIYFIINIFFSFYTNIYIILYYTFTFIFLSFVIYYLTWPNTFGCINVHLKQYDIENKVTRFYFNSRY